MQTRRFRSYHPWCFPAGRVLLLGAVLLRGLFSTADAAEPTWGGATNGVRLGVHTYTADSFGNQRPPFCILYVQNVSSNFIYLRFPRPDRRCAMELRRSDSNALCRKTGKTIFAEHDKIVRMGLRPKQVLQLDRFEVADVFELSGSGIYYLTVSVTTTTNLLPLNRATFFVLPQVTDAFTLRTSREVIH
jgi:hypothetical protein